MTDNQEIENNPETNRNYKKVVREIRELNWENLNEQELQQVMYLAYVSAREFAEALRIALRLYPNNPQLNEMAQGELSTHNLRFEDYDRPGDHADFLEYFLAKYKLSDNEELRKHADAYTSACRALSDYTRAMTIFSREEELSGIFEQILKAKNWSAQGLPAFNYYLRTHIALDSGAGGHHDLTKEFPIDDSVEPFYRARLEMYKAIPRLFKSE